MGLIKKMSDYENREINILLEKEHKRRANKKMKLLMKRLTEHSNRYKHLTNRYEHYSTKSNRVLPIIMYAPDCFLGRINGKLFTKEEDLDVFDIQKIEATFSMLLTYVDSENEYLDDKAFVSNLRQYAERLQKCIDVNPKYQPSDEILDKINFYVNLNTENTL